MAYLGWTLFVLLVVTLALAVAYGCYRIAFYNDRKEEDPYNLPKGEAYEKEAEKMRALIAKMDQLPYEQVYITAFDGLRLFGRYYHVADGAPLQIQFHGYRGNAIRDFCGGNGLAREAGQNTLVIDERAHGKSQGHTITMGIKERYDCLSWAKYAAERFGKDTPIFLSGVSMGAATVLMASELELPENVVGIIADCPYSSPSAIVRKVCRDVKLPPKLVYPFLVLGAFVYGHFCLWTASAETAVRKSKVPVLVIHGENDRFVPCEMSRQIYNACHEKVTLETFPEADHGLSFIVDPKRYEQVTQRFMDSCLHGWECH